MIDFIFKQRRAINLTFFFLIVMGLLAYTQLGTAELPEPPGTGLIINAVLPGASPDEMDGKVARLYQSAIKNVPGIDEVISRSRESMTTLRVKFVDDSGDIGALVQEITQTANQVQDLPVDLEGPFISRPSSRIFPAMTLVLQGGHDVQRHNAWQQINNVIRNIKEVEHTQVLGDRKRRVEIALDPLKLQQFSIRIDAASRIIQQAITDQSAGRVETFLSINRIRVMAQPHSIEELKNIPIKIGDTTLPLAALADVTEALAPKTIKIDYRGNDAWYINVFRRPNTKMQELSETLKRVVEQSNADFKANGQDLRLVILQDRSFIVERVLGELGKSIQVGMLLVLFVLWCFFGFHNALYAAIGIPFSFLATFIAMDMMDIDLNSFTLFGLVLVCGMIVDDAIVVLENIVSKLEQRIETRQAIKLGMLEVLAAVMASTGTTIAAFLPLLFITGGMGDFISQIPKVAILALIASLVECFVVLPAHIYQRHRKQATIGDIKHNVFNRTMERIATRFVNLAARVIQIPYKVLAGFIVLLSLTGALAYFTLDFKLFDADEVRSIRAHLTFPKTTDLELTSQLLSLKRKDMENIDMIEEVVILNGWNDYNYNQDIRSHYATIEVHLSPEAYKQHNADVVSDALEDVLATIPGVERLQLVQTKNKPPVSAPVKIYLYGNNANHLAKANANVISQLQTIESIYNITNPMEDGIPETVFNVDEEMAAHFELQPKEISQLLHYSVTGDRIAKMDMGEEVVDVYVKKRQSPDWRDAKIDHLTLANGEIIDIKQLGEFVTTMAPDTVRRFQGKRYISITADIDTSILSNFKTHREIEKRISDALLPGGISFEQQGEYAKTHKSLTSIAQSALLSIGLVYLILTLLFKSYTQPLIVLLTIPLAFVGVIIGMSLMGRDISLFGLVGVIGLIGIVVNDSLVWVSSYNQFRKKDESGEIPSADAALKAIKARFRPVMLTTITTIAGLLPVALSKSAGIAGSMASTIVSGLISASVLLLVFLPVCVIFIDDLSTKLGRKRLGALTPSPKAAGVSR